jgi:hypothetical protein
MKRMVLLLLLLCLAASPSPAQVPRCVVAEDCTATWCVYCPDAYAGLEVIRASYDPTEFLALRYYDTSGDLGTAETHSRLSTYYGVSAFPTVVLDGTNKIIGGGSTVAAGDLYRPAVASEVGLPSPLKITINSFSLTAPDGAIDCSVTVAQAIADISRMKIRIALLEDNVDWSGETMQYVTRDLLPETALSVSQVGQVQNLTQTFSVDPSWKSQDLWLAVLVQNDNGKSVVQATSTRTPAYAPRFWANSPRGAFRTANSGVYEFPDFAVYNMGTSADVIHLALETGSLGPGWSCVFTDGSNEYTSADLSLGPGAGQVFHLKVSVGAAGYLNPAIVLTSSNLPAAVKRISYAVVTEGPQVLVVDDDGGKSDEAIHVSALNAAGKSCAVWPTEAGEVTGSLLAAFPMVDWETGMATPTLTSSDQTLLTTYLDNGGRLFLSGTDLAYELNSAGGGSQWWLWHYLGANYVRDDTGFNLVSGVAGDPISDGMVMTPLTGSLNPSPDEISPFDDTATSLLVYGPAISHYRAGLKVDKGTYKLIFLTFPFQAFTNEADRNQFMQRSVDWLFAPSSAPEAGAGISPAGVRSWPNPARTGTDLHYTLAQGGDVQMDIYGLDGSLVRRLRPGSQTSGEHALRWDGRDDSGSPVAAGMYFYRLRGPGAGPTGKLILTR